ncbi:MAG: NADPH-dependent FMN reductase [Verrucomicrobiota bacterium JB022]|nr:NADPH-dependent FMN reductase [Verrucomicrobiota bacterium JB022]
MISIVAGTNRAGSTTLKLATFLAGLYRALGQEVVLLDLAELPLELLSPDSYRQKPASFVERFSEPLLESKGTHWVVPEYNGSFPGALKLLIDHLPYPDFYENRPAAFVGLSAGASGATRPIEHLQQVMAYRNGYAYNRRVFIPAAYQALEDGVPVEEDLRARLQRQVEGFIGFAQRVHAVTDAS